MTDRRSRHRDWLSIAAAILVVLGARASLADHYTVPTGSMRPTVEVGDRVLVDKRAYGLRLPLTERYLVEHGDPAVGDVVVLASPEDGGVLLKRVVAGPGDVVSVRRGRLVRDGRPAPLAREAGAWRERLGGRAHAIRLSDGGGPDLGPLTVPAGRYLVLGDNRGQSHDGRSFGLVERAAILGRAVGVFWRSGAVTWREL